ncbi:MAG: aminodeoxychorismate lyase [Ahniella sp.]|nr:aminodeoxychorismate lyase [Ahniella sp.]
MKCWRNGHPVAEDWAGLRALHYGDGHFTTMRVTAGRVVWWSLHQARLVHANERLRLDFDGWAEVEVSVSAIAADLHDGVLKLLFTRSSDRRGYGSAGARPEWLLFAEPGRPEPRTGLVLGVAQTRLAIQPALAGLKHLNRLEQVLARDEAPLSDCDDLLMCDMEAWIACTTSANVFLRADGQWRTPEVTRAGVAGVCRERILGLETVRVGPVSLGELLAADEVFCCNAVRGVMPVSRIGDRVFSSGPATHVLMSQVQAELEC